MYLDSLTLGSNKYGQYKLYKIAEFLGPQRNVLGKWGKIIGTGIGLMGCAHYYRWTIVINII